MPELTPDEAAFFETGELPESLIPAPIEPATPPQPPKVETAPTEPVPTPTPVPPATYNLNDLDRILEEKFARLQAQFVPPPTQPKVEVPDEETDPLGNMMHNLKSIQQRLDKNEQMASARQQMEQFTAACQAAKTDFETRQPDFKDAYAHIRALRTEDFRAAGAAEKDIPQFLMQDELQLAQVALQKGRNPAEELYTMAKRYGYAPKAPPAAPALPTAAQKMDQISAGQSADHNPSKSSQEADLTLAGLKDVSSKDLDKLVQDNKLWSTVVGGSSPSDIFNN